jgi:hypothetical protein
VMPVGVDGLMFGVHRAAPCDRTMPKPKATVTYFIMRNSCLILWDKRTTVQSTGTLRIGR